MADHTARPELAAIDIVVMLYGTQTYMSYNNHTLWPGSGLLKHLYKPLPELVVRLWSLNSRFLQTFHSPPSALTILATVAAQATPAAQEREPAFVVTQAAQDSDLFPPRQGVAAGEEFGYKPSRVTSGELEAVLEALDDDKIPEYAGKFGLDSREVKQRFLHLRQLYKSRVGHPAIDEKPRKVKIIPFNDHKNFPYDAVIPVPDPRTVMRRIYFCEGDQKYHLVAFDTRAQDPFQKGFGWTVRKVKGDGHCFYTCVYEALKTKNDRFFPGWKDVPDVEAERDACIAVMRRWVADAVTMDYAEGLVNALTAQHGLEYRAIRAVWISTPDGPERVRRFHDRLKEAIGRTPRDEEDGIIWADELAIGALEKRLSLRLYVVPVESNSSKMSPGATKKILVSANDQRWKWDRSSKQTLAEWAIFLQFHEGHYDLLQHIPKVHKTCRLKKIHDNLFQG
jgi:hypothetical protein